MSDVVCERSAVERLMLSYLLRVGRDHDVVVCEAQELIRLVAYLRPWFNLVLIICRQQSLLLCLRSITSAWIAGGLRSSSGCKSIHDSPSLLVSIWNLVIHSIKSEFPRLIFMNLNSRYRKTVCGLNVLLEYSIALPLGCLNSARSRNLLQAAASPSNLFLRAGPHFFRF